MYSSISVNHGDSAHSQAVLEECTRGNRLFDGGVTDLEIDQVTNGTLEKQLFPLQFQSLYLILIESKTLGAYT
ncbi:hypothetical protein NSMS1_07800 [Nostoc sp. MS1]|nr:hypothetical protein NSMS1_07800 [Nostoc sp. MS1]